MPKALRVGIVGAGKNTQIRHVPGLRACPDVSVVAVANRSIESAREAAKALGIPRAYAHWEDLVAADDIEAVVIGTWPNTHCDITIAALARGKHVLTEARMASTLDEAARMLDAAQHAGLVAQLVPAPQTIRIDDAVRRLLGNGAIGDVRFVRVDALGSSMVSSEAPLYWRNDADISGINTMSLGIWYENIMKWVGEATEVVAAASVFTRQRRDTGSGAIREVRVPDHLDVLGRLEGGGQLSMQVSEVAACAPSARVWIYGASGAIGYDAIADVLSLATTEGTKTLTLAAEEEGKWQVEDDFVAAIRDSRPVERNSFEIGYRYMAFTDAVSRSLQDEQWVQVRRGSY